MNWKVEFDRMDKVASHKSSEKQRNGRVSEPAYEMARVRHTYRYSSNEEPTLSASGNWLHAENESVNLNTIIPGSLRIEQSVGGKYVTYESLSKQGA